MENNFYTFFHKFRYTLVTPYTKKNLLEIFFFFKADKLEIDFWKNIKNHWMKEISHKIFKGVQNMKYIISIAEIVELIFFGIFRKKFFSKSIAYYGFLENVLGIIESRKLSEYFLIVPQNMKYGDFFQFFFPGRYFDHFFFKNWGPLKKWN